MKESMAVLNEAAQLRVQDGEVVQSSQQSAFQEQTTEKNANDAIETSQETNESEQDIVTEESVRECAKKKSNTFYRKINL